MVKNGEGSAGGRARQAAGSDQSTMRCRAEQDTGTLCGVVCRKVPYSYKVVPKTFPPYLQLRILGTRTRTVT